MVYFSDRMIMTKPLILLLFVLLPTVSLLAQETVSDTIPINKDSIEREVNAFLDMLDSLKQPKSYFQVGIGAGNMQYSVNNTALNAQQTKKNINITPVIAYYHKSGFGIAYNGFIAMENGSSSFYQHTITPSYDYESSEKFGAGITYTRYFKGTAEHELASPYKNDFYGYAEYKKWKIKPSISLGFANGKQSQYSQTDTFAVIKHYLRPDTTVFYKQYDTMNVKLRDYSVIASVRSKFTWDGITTHDYIVFSTAFMMYFGLSDYNIEYISKGKLTPDLIQYFRLHKLDAYQFAKKKFKFPSSRNYNEMGEFNLQSLGINLDLAWYIKKFYINPQVYFDYYLLSSKNKFNTLFTMHTGFMF